MAYKIAGETNQSSEIIVLNNDGEKESNTTVSGVYDVTTTSGLKIVIARGPQGESYGYSDVTPYELVTAVGLDSGRMSSDLTLSNEDFTITKTGSNLNYDNVFSQVTHSTGKWYFEVTMDETTDNSENWFGILSDVYETARAATSYLGYPTTLNHGVVWYDYNGAKYYPGEVSIPSPGRDLINGDVMSVAADLNDLKIWFAINGQWVNSGNPSAGTNQLLSINSHTYYAGFILRKVNMQMSANFGQTAFQYTVPTGFTGWGL
jgi:hypothetical protein